MTMPATPYAPLDIYSPGFSQPGYPPPTPPSATFSVSSRDCGKTEIGIHDDSHCSGCQCSAPNSYVQNSQDHKKGGAFFGVKHTRSQATQPLVQDHKCREDPEYQEMGESANLWNTYLNESAKVDADKVSNWTDALDVLLVFAGLFSAVVTTFVCQTYQNLQVDYSEVTAHLIYELLHVARAISEGLSARDVPASALTPESTFRPSLSARWINSLWFMSLVLSLTTALIAVLTKQWIHEYVDSTQIGSLRARSRIRQFRFINLEEWHVPVIIGLLPVMMHIALGAFLAGLIILLLSLDYVMAGAVSIVVAGALMWYIITNILPVYDPSCPYRTPLTAYVYALSYYLHCLDIIPPFLLDLVRRIRTVRSANAMAFQDDDPPLEMPGSLKDAEGMIVDASADVLDGKAVGWLYNISSNAVVQREVLQSISNISLTGAEVLISIIGPERLEDAFDDAFLAPGIAMPVNATTLERLSRALIRLFPKRVPPCVPDYLFETPAYPLPILINDSLHGRARAERFLCQEISNPSAKLDVVVWIHIFRNALINGLDWLKFERDDSGIWLSFMGFFMKFHACPVCLKPMGRLANHHHVESLYTLQLEGKAALLVSAAGPDGDTGHLSISTHNSERTSTTEAITLDEAISLFMAPSLAKLVFERLYASKCHASVSQKNIPDDVRLRLALVQSPFFQKTSGSCFRSLFTQIMEGIRESVGVDTYGKLGVYAHHDKIPSATFHSLQKLVTKDLDTLCLDDQRLILQPFFRTLLLDESLHADYRACINLPLAERIVELIFSRRRLDMALVADLMEAMVVVQCSMMLPMLYARLRDRDWLKKIDPTNMEDELTETTLFFHSFVASAYIDGLRYLQRQCPAEYRKTLTYLEGPAQLFTLCQILILSNCEISGRLWTLVPLVHSVLWRACLHGLDVFISQPATLGTYHMQRRFYNRHPHRFGQMLLYRSDTGLANFLKEFSGRIRVDRESSTTMAVYDSARRVSCRTRGLESLQAPNFSLEMA